MNKTDKNLLAAFAGESQANRRYLAFAKQAEAEGFTQTAKLFKAAAEAETVHALNHLRVTGAVKSTAENLNAAVAGETHEFIEMQTKSSRYTQSCSRKLANQSIAKKICLKPTSTSAAYAATPLKATHPTNAPSVAHPKPASTK
jgi:rubrerythrin